MTTTTVNAVEVMQQLEYLLQAEWPELDVYATSVTEQWAAAALSGPKARSVVAERRRHRRVERGVSVSRGRRRATCAQARRRIPARLFRMSYSGELAYEIHVPADRGRAMWEAVLAAGEPFGIMPYGTEAMSTLRIEKGPCRRSGRKPTVARPPTISGMGKLVNAGEVVHRQAAAGAPRTDGARTAGSWSG